ncbi:hypothetical protein FEZ41_01835 [Lentilactobacillus parafarraginis]|nr:hypothetical protein FEZ41_01835 [Lentilactobacillus parafarraginis]
MRESGYSTIINLVSSKAYDIKEMAIMDAIRYYSRTGNTEKLANMLADQLNVKAETIDTPITDTVDRLFLGGGVYNMSADKHLKEYAKDLDPTKVKEVYLFGTSGSVFTIEKQISKILDKKKIPIADQHLFLHGVMPKMGNISSHQQKEVTDFVKGAVTQ